MNRITAYLSDSAEDPQYGDFYLVYGEFGCFGVSHAEARRIEWLLARWLVPKWIVFHDRAGSRVRVRTRGIRSLVESTAAQRAIDRQFDRARADEEKKDRRSWEDD
jgi:hypothetical protein